MLWAQAESEAGSQDVFKETFADLSLIGYMGLGGAVLGLSTLSFVQVPKENLKNIVVGGALGIIAGVGVVAWKQATKSQESFSSEQSKNEGPTTFLKVVWEEKSLMEEQREQRLLSYREPLPLYLNWDFEF